MMVCRRQPMQTETTDAPGHRRYTGLGRRAILVALAVAIALPMTATAQFFFPVQDPVPVLTDDFEAGIGLWTDLSGGTWTTDPATAWCWNGQGNHLAESGARLGGPMGLALNMSIPSSVDTTSFRVEFAFVGTAVSQTGFFWAAQPDSDGNGVPDAAYLFYIDRFPTVTDAQDPTLNARAWWHLVRIESGVMSEIATAPVELDPGDIDLLTTFQSSCYRLRVDWFCGNLRVQVRREVFDATCLNGCYEGCGGGCSNAQPELCWCTLLEWTDPSAVSLPAGMIGLYSGSSSAALGETYFDNFSLDSWGPTCLICTDWSNYSVDWAGATTAWRDRIRFKYLYEAALHDYKVTNDVDTSGGGFFIWGRVDEEALATIDGTCAGMDMLVDMIEDTLPTSGEQLEQSADIKAYFEPISSAVKFEKAADGTFSYANRYDFTAGTDFNPVPIVAHGRTPIAAAMLDAYNWYKAEKTGTGNYTDGVWHDDPLAICRKWYVILITDGEEECNTVAAGETPVVCADGQAAKLFATPDWAGATEHDAVKVSTIGFSESVGADSPLQCIATETGGTFYSATNAAELADSLTRIINSYQEADRAFVPVSVAPPPTTLSAGSQTDYLVTVPIFVPLNERSLWDGHLHAFQLNSTQRFTTAQTAPPFPDEEDGQIDDTHATHQWDAAASLQAQIDASEGRKLYYSTGPLSGVWARQDLSTVKTNATLKTDFRGFLLRPGTTDGQIDSIIDFMYFYDPAHRPADYAALGDFYHSKPMIVGSPRNPVYLANNINNYYADYFTVHQRRRRVVFAGANDGLLHAFDIGQYNTANNQYTTGTGKELFGHMPRAVMDKLYQMAALPGNREQEYMVDGPVVAADIFIDPTATGDDPGDSAVGDREWRTAILYSLRGGVTPQATTVGGGRSLVALDVTRPDSLPFSAVSTIPVECHSGTATGCDGAYPRVMWEFLDTSDADINGEPDLGWTWSEPVIARVKLATDDEMHVAFFGGGWDYSGTNSTGTHFYGVDMETGKVVYKTNIGSSLPGGVTALDIQDDGFIDRVYFATSAGEIYRLDVSAETTLTEDVSASPPGYYADDWDLTRLYNFGGGVKFFTKPTLVPAYFDGTTYSWALAIGSGDQITIDLEDSFVNRFYFVLDYTFSDGTSIQDYTESNLQGVAYNAGIATDGASYLDPGAGVGNTFGWYMTLRGGGKVSANAIAVNEEIQFPSFERLPFDGTLVDDEGDPICQASGTGRLYRVNYTNADPVLEDEDGNPGPRGEDLGGGLIVGGTDYTVGDQTVALWTTMDGRQQEIEILQFRFHRVTNWRQE